VLVSQRPSCEDLQASPLLDLLEKLPDLVDAEVLRRLDPADRAFFAQVSHGCRAAVLASELPCAGTRVGLGQLNPADRARLAGEVRAFDPDRGCFPVLGYVESSDLPRAGGVVRLELSAFATSATRLAWAKASGCRWDELTCGLAAQGGHLEALKWAREHGCQWSERTCRYAAEGGHLEGLRWARAHGCPWEELRICVKAAEGGHLAVLKWLQELGALQDCPCDETGTAAARGGHLDVLKWARAHGCPFDRWTSMAAAQGGHLDVLMWLREISCPWDAMTCRAAALGGHLEVLQWARQHHCPWDAITCQFAAAGRHLEVLQWARAHGCEWDEATIRVIATEWDASGHQEVLMWLDGAGE